MRLLTFLRFMRQILRDRPADLDWIQRQGLLAVKLTQIFALRSDILSDEKCQQLQTLYQNASQIPAEDVFIGIDRKAPIGFREAFESIDEIPLASASVASIASTMVSHTGACTLPRSTVWPPFRGVTPPTISVPYSTILVAWKVP